MEATFDVQAQHVHIIRHVVETSIILQVEEFGSIMQVVGDYEMLGTNIISCTLKRL